LEVTCAVITPIGPGHEKTYKERCYPSILAARNHGMGLFDNIEVITVDDTMGKVGRSRARNQAVKTAHAQNHDWVFFLDADDFLFDAAFENASKHLNHVDGLWGAICEANSDLSVVKIRPKQLKSAATLKEILSLHPFLTLQMGHFVRTNVAITNPFNENLDCGEDFEYYFKIWSKYRCKKIEEILFLNIRGGHSTGPRAADGMQWNNVVSSLWEDWKQGLTV